jgi:hypothetical protein
MEMHPRDPPAQHRRASRSLALVGSRITLGLAIRIRTPTPRSLGCGIAAASASLLIGLSCRTLVDAAWRSAVARRIAARDPSALVAMGWTPQRRLALALRGSACAHATSLVPLVLSCASQTSLADPPRLLPVLAGVPIDSRSLIFDRLAKMSAGRGADRVRASAGCARPWDANQFRPTTILRRATRRADPRGTRSLGPRLPRCAADRAERARRLADAAASRGAIAR